MSLTIGNISETTSSRETSQKVSTKNTKTENLFEANNSDKVQTTGTTNQALLEAQLTQLEAELESLEADKSEKEAYVKELEAQKKTIEAQKKEIKAQIEANEEEIKENEEIIEQNEQKIEKAQEEIEKLEEQYNAKNQEASELNEQINDKIAKIIKDSDADVAELSEKIKQATEEAYEKVESGEIKESEVSQYVAQKVGNSSISASTADFAAINAMNLQLRSLISGAKEIYNQMGAQQAAITGYQSNITNAINANAEIVKKNTPLNNQLKELNAQENTINKEIQSVNTEIAIIDGNITEVKTQIAAIEASINSSKIIEYTHKVTVAQNSTIADFEYNTGLTDTENVKTDTQYNPANPFLAFSYDTTQYLNMTDALEAMAANNEQNIQTAQNQVESNREEIRKMFQDLLK